MKHKSKIGEDKMKDSLALRRRHFNTLSGLEVTAVSLDLKTTVLGKSGSELILEKQAETRTTIEKRVVGDEDGIK